MVRSTSCMLVLAGSIVMTFGAASSVGAAETGFRMVPSYYSREFGSGGETNLAALPLGVVFRFPRQEVRATLPYLSYSGQAPDVSFRFFGPRVIEGEAFRESGPGDLSLRYAYLLVPGDDGGAALSGSLRVKLPTADEEDGLGTGEADVEPGVALVHTPGLRWTVFGRAGYLVRGDPPDVDLGNSLSGVVGGRYTMSERTGVTLSAGAREGRDYRIEGFDLWSLDGETTFDVAVVVDRRLTSGMVVNTGALVTRSEETNGFGLSLGFTWNDSDPSWAP